MAAGEYNSMRVQAELLQRELSLERREIERNPQVEAVELAQRYQSRGIDHDLAREFADSLISRPDVALEFHAREELGVIPGELGSPVSAAVSSFVAFSIGASLPLVPWFSRRALAAKVASIVLALVAAVAVGVAIARLTEGNMARSVGRQLVFTAVPAALTYAIGSLVGVGITWRGS
ncbi:MAG: VIT1/CCC1 transporter family protein [Acidimicrobiales bacterium]